MSYFELFGLFTGTIGVLWVLWDLVHVWQAPSHGETLSRLAHHHRREYVRRGRWVRAEDIRRDIERADPPLYTYHSFQN